jgi:hypothetical protein
MYAAIGSGLPANHVLQPSTMPERKGVNGTVPTVGSDSHCDHDPTLLMAALEDIETRRAAIEWLFDANLLHPCLI